MTAKLNFCFFLFVLHSSTRFAQLQCVPCSYVLHTKKYNLLHLLLPALAFASYSYVLCQFFFLFNLLNWNFFHCVAFASSLNIFIVSYCFRIPSKLIQRASPSRAQKIRKNYERVLIMKRFHFVLMCSRPEELPMSETLLLFLHRDV